MSNELEQLDPETLTPSQASSLLRQKLEANLQNNPTDDIVKEWATVRALNPKLVARMEAPAAALSNGTDAEVNSREQVASRKAHLASSLAEGKQGHLAAAAAHETAAEAQSNARNYETADMHRRMATYHASQANQPEKS